MKFSYCSIAFRNQNIALNDIISFLAREGYDGIELWGNHVDFNTDLVALKHVLEQASLKVPMISPYFNFTSDSKNWEESVKSAGKCIETALSLKAPLIRVFTGIVGSQMATKQQKNSCVEALKIVCEKAYEKGISLALETHPSTLVDNAYATIDLIEKVNAPNLKVNLDIYHMFEVHKNPLTVLDILFPYVAHVHAKNAVLSPDEHQSERHPLLHDPNPKAVFLGVRPLASGEMDYKPFIQSLQNRGFDGFISVEWFGDNPLTAASTELAYLKSHCHPEEQIPKQPSFRQALQD